MMIWFKIFLERRKQIKSTDKKYFKFWGSIRIQIKSPSIIAKAMIKQMGSI